MLFKELLGMLPDCLGPEALPLNGDGTFRYVRAEPSPFVEPTLGSLEEIPNDPTPSVILISAAGAVGKSIFAEVAAARKSAPLWDLSREGPVGTHSLKGRFLESFGIQDFARMDIAMGLGQMFIIIDALDEARLKTNEDAFQTFLSDIAAMAARGTSPCFMLLGRTQVTETAWLVLQEAGVRCAAYTVERFDEDSSIKYIDLRVASHTDRLGTRAALEYPKPYRAARDAVLARLRGAITDNDVEADEGAVREFLGYAPVLDAVATLIANTGNFEALRESFNRSATDRKRERPVGILAQIVHDILIREQEQKLVRNLKPGLIERAIADGLFGANTSVPADIFDQLYSPEEQAVRLTSRMLGLTEPFTTGLPPSIAMFYEEQVLSFLTDHPFMRESDRPANSVFESFLLARVLVHGGGRFRAAAERWIAGDAHKPTSLLAQFYFYMIEQTGSRTIPAEHVGILYDSMRAGETESARVWLTVSGLEPGEEPISADGFSADVEFDVMTRSGASTSEEVSAVLAPGAALRFPRHLANAWVTAPCAVTLGTGSRAPLVGPSVYLDCDRLLIPADRFSAVGSSHNADPAGVDVILRALSYEGNVSRKLTVHGTMQVSWPGATSYPWTEFAVPQGARSVPPGPLADAYRRFRRIILTLRSHKKGALARYRGKVEHRRVLKGSVGEALLARLVRDHILELHENFYYLNPETAANLVGVTWYDLTSYAWTERLEAYLREFTETHADLFR